MRHLAARDNCALGILRARQRRRLCAGVHLLLGLSVRDVVACCVLCEADKWLYLLPTLRSSVGAASLVAVSRPTARKLAVLSLPLEWLVIS